MRRSLGKSAQLQAAAADGEQLADWFSRFYVFVVQGNLSMPEAERAHWFAPHPDVRSRDGSFWQDGSPGWRATAG